MRRVKCKFARVKAINTLGMANPCPLLGGFGGMLPRETFVKIGYSGEFGYIRESDFVLNIFLLKYQSCKKKNLGCMHTCYGGWEVNFV